MKKYKFSNNENVAFSYGGMFGYGEVVGVATDELPILGFYYIIKVHVSNREIPNKDYPFSVVTIPEIGMLKLTLGEPRQLAGLGMSQPIYLNDLHIATLKAQYLNALRIMPQPEKLDLVILMAKSLIATGKIPKEVTFEHLVSLIRYTIECP